MTKTAQTQPGTEISMMPEPQSYMEDYTGSNKLKGKVALISGGDSGIGRAVAVGYAKEGADVAIIYLEEEVDACKTLELVEATGQKALLIQGDVSSKSFCENALEDVISEFGKINILVNNAAEQHLQDEFENISESQLRRTFDTNLFGSYFLTQAALKHLKSGDCIINSVSVVAYKGKSQLIDYASTKGALVSFTRSLSQNLAGRNIRVNGVAPGPIWTPLIPASFPEEQLEDFGSETALGRAGQPDEVAPSFIFLASTQDSSYITGQVLHPNGGMIVNG